MQRNPLTPHYERQFSMNCDVSRTKRRTRHSPGCLFARAVQNSPTKENKFYTHKISIIM